MDKPIISTLLSTENSMRLTHGTIGEQLQNLGIAHLWADYPSQVDTIVIHSMSAIERTPQSPFNLEELLQIFIDYGVSAHFLILRNGDIHQLVPLSHMAWHAGGSQMPAPDNRIAVNHFSFGIEMVGTDLLPFTLEQYASLSQLLTHLASSFPITSIIGHSTISGERSVNKGLRTVPKTDPGPQFEWIRLPRTILAKCITQINE